MLGQLRADIDLVAIGMVDHQPSCMQVHLAADPDAAEEGIGPAIFAVAHDRVADRSHMHTRSWCVRPVSGWSSTQAALRPARSTTR